MPAFSPLTPLLRSLPAVLALVALCAGCTSRTPDDPRRAVLENYADIVLATYEDSLSAARELQQAIEALLADPSETTLEAARASWRAARIPYSASEAFRFYGGPIDTEDGPEPRLNGWPLDENHIDAVAETYNAAPGIDIIGSPDAFPEITPELIAEQNEAGGEKNIASGWHAIEFLLWGQDTNDPPDAPGRRPYTDFIPDGDPATDRAARRGQYLRAATTLLISDLESLVDAWRKLDVHDADGDGEPDNYRATFVSGDVYTGLKRMFTGIAALSEVEMAGERMEVPLLSGDQEEEQNCFSDTTIEDLRANAAGIEHVYFGRYTRLDGSVVEGPSLAQLVREADPRVADEMQARMARVREALAAIQSPFDLEIQPDNEAGRARVRAAIDALRAQSLSMFRAAEAMQIFLSDLEGLGD